MDGSAETLCLWFDDLVDRFEVFIVHMEERGCLPVSFFFFKNKFSSICPLYSFHFLVWNLRGVGGEAIVKHFI